MTVLAPTQAGVSATAAPTSPESTRSRHAVDVLRIGLGLVFLWAFLDKTFGLGFSTKSAQAWIHGGSPTQGFLGHVEVGPLQSTFRSIAGAGWVNTLFMLALLGLGVALIAGVASDLRSGRHGAAGADVGR